MLNNSLNFRSNLEEVKSKLIIEKHDREQEINNNRLMMKVNYLKIKVFYLVF